MTVGGDVLQALKKLRGCVRTGLKYNVFRAVYMKLEDMVRPIAPNDEERERIIQDLENIAIGKAIDQYAWMKDDYIWSYSHKSRKTQIRNDMKDVFEKRIIRSDDLLRDFLINVELMTLIKEYNGNAEAFWQKIGVECDESSKKKYA